MTLCLLLHSNHLRGGDGGGDGGGGGIGLNPCTLSLQGELTCRRLVSQFDEGLWQQWPSSSTEISFGILQLLINSALTRQRLLIIIIIITTICNWRRNTAMPLQGRLTVN